MFGPSATPDQRRAWSARGARLRSISSGRPTTGRIGTHSRAPRVSSRSEGTAHTSSGLRRRPAMTALSYTRFDHGHPESPSTLVGNGRVTPSIVGFCARVWFTVCERLASHLCPLRTTRKALRAFPEGQPCSLCVLHSSAPTCRSSDFCFVATDGRRCSRFHASRQTARRFLPAGYGRFSLPGRRSR